MDIDSELLYIEWMKNIMYQFIRNSINMSGPNNGNVIEENMFTFLKLPMTFKLGIYVTLIYFL